MNIFITIAITGIDETLRNDRIAAAVEHITKAGHTPFNPVEITAHLHKYSRWEDYMIVLYPYLLGSQALYVTDGWQNSTGCRVEHAIATALRLQIVGEHSNLKLLK